MVMTILEARVAPDRIAELEGAYREGVSPFPPGLVETFLVCDSRDTTLYRIITVWASREALENMHASTEKPKGVQFFEAAGATPKLSVLDIVVHQPS